MSDIIHTVKPAALPDSAEAVVIDHEHSRTALSSDALRRGIEDHLR
jgi:hypothetical protein